MMLYYVYEKFSDVMYNVLLTKPAAVSGVAHNNIMYINGINLLYT